MKGLTNAPLVIWVAREWFERPEILTRMRQGHRVVNMDVLFNTAALVSREPDLILHSAAGWTEELFDYLPAALTRARARRKKK